MRDIDTKPTHSLISEYLYGQPLYPAAPFSWLAPWLAFVCGTAASASWEWTAGHLLRLLSGLLLAGPLLGTAWAASTQTEWRERAILASSADRHKRSRPVLPYTCPGSQSATLSALLSRSWATWQQVKPWFSRPLLHLAGSSVFALVIAAQLGPSCLFIAFAVLLIGYGAGWSRTWRANPMASAGIPLFAAWLLGHAAYSTLRPVPVLAAASFCLAFCSLSVLKERPSSPATGLVGHAVSWLIAVGSLVVVMQPIVAAAVGLLGSLPLLLAPLLETEREQYFRTDRKSTRLNSSHSC